jgi:ABC-type antimicrobial peptide transport system permease subunit
VIAVSPLTRQQEGDEVVIGSAEKEVFLAVPVEAAELLDQLAQGKTIGEVEESYRETYGETPDLDDFLSALETLLNNSMAGQRFAMLLLAMFGGLSLLLACIGMYGVISLFSLERKREIGIRLALGATRANVFTKILGQGARLAGLGVALGLAVVVAVTRLMADALYGVDATDPLTFSGVSLLLMGVALLVCYLPARRATRIEPMSALRF